MSGYSPIRSLAEFERRVTFGETVESRHLEFKQAYDDRSKKNNARECARDLAQFANAEGGTLLLGVTETTHPDGRHVASGIVTVPDAIGEQWLNQAIRNHAAPATFSRSVDRIDHPEGVVWAINVPPSLDLVAVWSIEQHGIEYLYRTDHGKQWMNPDEVERHLMDGSRAVRLALQDAVAAVGGERPVLLVPAVYEVRVSHGRERLMPTDLGVRLVFGAPWRHVELHVGTTLVNIPLALIRAVWTTPDHMIGLCLCVRLLRAPSGREVQVLPLP